MSKKRSVPAIQEATKAPHSSAPLSDLLYLRVTPAMVAALDRAAAKLSEQTGLDVTRSDVVRKIVADFTKKFLDIEELPESSDKDLRRQTT